MAKLTMYQNGSARTLVETDLPEVDVKGGVVRVSRVGDAIQNAETTFQDAIAHVGPIAKTIVETLDEVRKTVQEIEVEFGIKLSAEAGVVLARASSEANLSVKIKLTRNS